MKKSPVKIEKPDLRKITDVACIYHPSPDKVMERVNRITGLINSSSEKGGK